MFGLVLAAIFCTPEGQSGKENVGNALRNRTTSKSNLKNYVVVPVAENAGAAARRRLVSALLLRGQVRR